MILKAPLCMLPLSSFLFCLEFLGSGPRLSSTTSFDHWSNQHLWSYFVWNGFGSTTSQLPVHEQRLHSPFRLLRICCAILWLKLLCICGCRSFLWSLCIRLHLTHFHYPCRLTWIGKSHQRLWTFDSVSWSGWNYWSTFSW